MSRLKATFLICVHLSPSVVEILFSESLQLRSELKQTTRVGEIRQRVKPGETLT